MDVDRVESPAVRGGGTVEHMEQGHGIDPARQSHADSGADWQQRRTTRGGLGFESHGRDSVHAHGRAARNPFSGG